MTTPQLETELNAYKTALFKIKDSQPPLSAEPVLEVLNARDAVEAALKELNQIAPANQRKLVELDALLKEQAEQIVKVIDLAEYRSSFHPPAEAWWWRLEIEALPHLWDRWDWLWRGLTVTCWTVNLGLLVDIVPRFLSSGTGFVGAAAVAFPSILTLLQARSELTQAGKEGFEKLLTRLRIPKYLHEEARLGSTVLLLAFLLGFRVFLPAISDWYNRQGVNRYREGQLASAEAKYLQALAINPDNIKAHYNLGAVYEDLQQFDKARMQYQFAVKGNLVRAQNNLARLQILDDKAALAVPLLLKGLTQIDEQPLRVRYNLMKNLGWAFLEDERGAEAEKILQGAIQLASTPEGIEQIQNRGSAHCLLAQVYQQQKRQSEAIAQWQECCQWGSMFNPDEDKWLSLAHKQLKEAGKPCGQGNGEP